LQQSVNLSKISPSTKHKDLYQIFIDNKFLCSISGNDLLESRLAVGDTIDQPKLADLLYRSLKGKLSSAVLGYLGSRPHSESEIRQYLKKKLYAQVKETAEYKTIDTSRVIDEIVSQLKNLNYINDEEFANWLVTQRISSRNPKSKTAIRAELQAKGIAQPLITQSLENLTKESEEQKALDLATKKLKLLQNRISDQKELKLKLSRYLASKGYSWETIQSVVDSILNPF
jgi:regulatory protein